MKYGSICPMVGGFAQCHSQMAVRYVFEAYFYLTEPISKQKIVYTAYRLTASQRQENLLIRRFDKKHLAPELLLQKVA